VLVFRVIGVALRSDRKEGEPDAVAACGLLARLVVRVACVASWLLRYATRSMSCASVMAGVPA
jgi:hypothetical protein